MGAADVSVSQVGKTSTKKSRNLVKTKQVALAKSCILDLTTIPPHWRAYGALPPTELDKIVRNYRNMNKVMVVINQGPGYLSVDVWGFRDNMKA